MSVGRFFADVARSYKTDSAPGAEEISSLHGVELLCIVFPSLTLAVSHTILHRETMSAIVGEIGNTTRAVTTLAKSFTTSPP